MKNRNKLIILLRKPLTSITKIIKKNKLLSFIIFIALLVRLWGLLPNYLSHPDEGWVTVISQKLFYNILIKGDFDPHGYKYGSFIIYLETLPHFPVMLTSYFLELMQNTFLPVQPMHPMPSFLQYIADMGTTQYYLLLLWLQRALVAILGGFSVLILYFIVKKLINKNAGLFSAFIFAVAPVHVRDSHYVTTDVPVTFFILLSMLFMINLFQSSKLKWYILSGITIGFSSTVRYFPIAVLAYPFAVLLDKQKNLTWGLKIFSGLLSIPLGIFIGVPFLFLHPENKAIFQQDMQKYILPWYQTSISDYATALGQSITSGGHTILPNLTSLQPTSFKQFYLSFLFFHGFGIFPMIAAIFGILLTLIKYPKKFLFIITIPGATFLYISSYIPATYDRLVIPVVPFLAIFVGIFLSFFLSLLKRYRSLKMHALFIVLFGSIVYFPIAESFASSWACGQKDVSSQSVDWIYANIPDNSIFAFKTAVPAPSAKPLTGIEMKVQGNFSLEEVANEKAQYAFINETSIYDQYTGNFLSDFFIPPADLHDNSFPFLSLYEYKTRAKLLKQISVPVMCAEPTLLYYQLPPKLPKATKLIKSFSFDTVSDMDFWRMQDYSIKAKKVGMSHTKNEGMNKPGALQGRWENYSYTPPRIISEKIKAKENDAYTFSAWVKFSNELTEIEKDGFLRIDFYNDWNKSITLPGDIVALSPRTYGKPKWRKLTITAKAPPQTAFMTVSLQVNGIDSTGSFYFDDMEILGPQ